MYQFDHFLRAGVKHAVSQRSGGVSRAPYESLNLALHTGDQLESVLQNRRIFSAIFGCEKIVFMEQIHGDGVELISELPSKPPVCDAMVTQQPNLALAVMVADCVPIMFFCPHTLTIAVAHAGNKGTAERIAVKTVAAMAACGAQPENILVGIGAAICGECYEVGGDTAERFRAYPTALRAKPNGKFTLDLKLVNELMLRQSGVRRENIEVCQHCAFEDENYFSYRRDGVTGRFAGVITL